jgi:hypothetical protein
MALENFYRTKTAVWIGRIMSTLPVLLLLMSAGMKFAKPPAVMEGFAHLQLPTSIVLGLGILELTCTILYVIPQTAVLGAILLTGYLGGATLTHLRIGESWIMATLLGVPIWGGLYLRDSRVRELIPLRRQNPQLTEPTLQGGK